MEILTANLRSSSYLLASTHAQCERCNASSRVIALVLPPKHETRVDGRWQHAEAHAFIFYVEDLPSAVTRRLIQLAPLYSRKHGEGERNPYWANHCEHCGSMFSDDALHCEPGGFMPTLVAEAEAISLSHVTEGFSALAAGYAFDPAFLASMRRR